MSDYSLRSLWVRLSASELYSAPVEELLKLTKQSDQKAYCALYDRFKHEIARYSYFLCENEKKSQKLTQDAFLGFYKEARHDHLIGKDFEMWLYRHVTQSFCQSALPLKALNRSVAALPEDSWASLGKVKKKTLIAALEELSAPKRAIIILWLFSSLDNEQQAKVFELSTKHWSLNLDLALSELVQWCEEITAEEAERGS